MHRWRRTFLLVIPILLTKLFAQHPSSLPIDMLNLLKDDDARSKLIQNYSMNYFPAGDLIVGFQNPDEVREINSPLNIYGNIIIVNNGQLRFNNVEIKLQGNIIIMHNGKLEVNGGVFTVSQFFLYQYSALVMNKAVFSLNNTAIRFSGFSFACGLTDTTALNINQTKFTNGIMTTAVSRYASVTAIGSEQVGEYLFFEHTKGTFENCDGVLTWFVAPPQSDIDLSFPTASLPGEYVFPDSARKAVGVDYRLSYKTCFNTFWGLMTHTGSKVQVSNSNLLACGAIFEGSGQRSVQNLVNKTSYETFQYPSTDRNLRFTNTTINVWNLYPSDEVNLTVQNCIFGEIISQQKSTVLVSNSVCDGTGGFVGCTDSSRMTIVQSQLQPEVNVRKNGFLLLLLCNLPNSAMHVIDRGVLALMNTNYSSLPMVDPESVALIGSIDEPSSGFVGQKLRIYGSARLIAGSSIPVFLSSHWLEYGLASDPNTWYKIGNPSSLERYRDTLGVWDTKGLSAGEYVLRLNLKISSGDTLHVDRAVRLLNAPVSVNEENMPNNFFLGQNYPNPFSGSTAIGYRLLASGILKLEMFDIFGRKVATLIDGILDPGEHTVSFNADGLTNGVYLYRLIVNGNSQTRMMVIQ